MIICDYYRGGTDKLSGHIYDTEKKTYKKFAIKGDDWTETRYSGNKIFSVMKDGFKVPCDVDYYFRTLAECEDKLKSLIRLGFVEDEEMPMDFGLQIDTKYGIKEKVK